MKIMLNGDPVETDDCISVDALLGKLGYQESFVAVAINKTCVSRKSFAQTTLKEDDQVEILAPMAGG